MLQQAAECPQNEAQVFTKQKQYRFCLKNTLPDHGYIMQRKTQENDIKQKGSGLWS